MKYKIRSAEPRDIGEIIKLCAEHAEFEKAKFSETGKAEKLAKFLFSENPPVFCLVVENETGELLGYTAFMPEFSTWDADYYVYMDCLFLRPHARNFGIGEQLIKEIAKFAKERNIEQIQWHTPDFNERAIKFYHRIGAKSKEKTRFYLNENMIEVLAKWFQNSGEKFMKKILLVLVGLYIFTLPQTSFGQTNPNQPITIAVVKSTVDEFIFTADRSSHNDKTKEMQLIGNVEFQSKNFEFSGADKVIYNETAKKMTVYGCQDFTINGKIVVKSGEKLSNILEYTIGDDKVYLF